MALNDRLIRENQRIRETTASIVGLLESRSSDDHPTIVLMGRLYALAQVAASLMNDAAPRFSEDEMGGIRKLFFDRYDMALHVARWPEHKRALYRQKGGHIS
jgi:hypothetical protein